MAAHSSVLAWRIPGTGGPGRLPSMGLYGVGHDWSDLAAGGAAWGSRGKNTAVVCHSLLQWTTFGQNAPPWPVRLGWPHTAWLIASLSHAGLWSTWLFWLVSCDCGFPFGGCGIAVLAPSICPLRMRIRGLCTFPMGGTGVGKAGSCSGGQATLRPWSSSFSASVGLSFTPCVSVSEPLLLLLQNHRSCRIMSPPYFIWTHFH